MTDVVQQHPRLIETKHSGQTQIRHRRITPQPALAIAPRFGEEVGQADIADHQQATGPGEGIEGALAQHRHTRRRDLQPLARPQQALPGGGGVKAAIKGYRIAIKTGTAKKVGPDGRYINKYIAYTAGVAPASHPRFALVVVINDPQAGKYYGGAVSAPVFGAIMGGVLRTMNIEPDALATGEKSEFVINQGEGTGGRS